MKAHSKEFFFFFWHLRWLAEKKITYPTWIYLLFELEFEEWLYKTNILDNYITDRLQICDFSHTLFPGDAWISAICQLSF